MGCSQSSDSAGEVSIVVGVQTPNAEGVGRKRRRQQSHLVGPVPEGGADAVAFEDAVVDVEALERDGGPDSGRPGADDRDLE